MSSSGNGIADSRTPGTRHREPERAQRAFEAYVAMGPGALPLGLGVSVCCC